MPNESDRRRRYGSLDTIMANRAFSCNDSDACTTVAASNIQHCPPPSSRFETSTLTFSWMKIYQRYFRRNPRNVQSLNDVESPKRFNPNPPKHHNVSDDNDLVTVKSMPKTPSTTELSPSSWSSSHSFKPKICRKQEMTNDLDLVSVKSLPKRTTTSNTLTYSSRPPFTFQDMDTDDIDLVSVKSMPKVRPRPSLYSSYHPKGSSTITPFRRVSSDDFDLVTVKSLPKPRSHPSSSSSVVVKSSLSSMAPSNTSRTSQQRTRQTLSNKKPLTLDIDVDALHSSLGIGIVSVTSYTRPSS